VTDFGRRRGDHKTTHQDGGADEISIEGLSGRAADDQSAAAHALGGTKHTGATLAELNAKVSDATLDDSGSSRPPSAHKASHQDGGADEIDCSLLPGRHQYVDRGDPVNWDWDVADFTFDGTWRALDCSGIVPAGAKFIYFRVSFKTGAAGESFSLRKSGNSNTIAASAVRIQAFNYFNEQSFIVPCTTARVVDYYTTGTPEIGCNVAILGWFI